MMRWLTLILSVVLLGVVLAPGIRGEVPFGAAEATFVVTYLTWAQPLWKGGPGFFRLKRAGVGVAR